MGGKITARGCTRLRSLPGWIGLLTQLDLQGCSALEKLPEGLRVTEWIDIAGTRIRKLPKSLSAVEIRWRGVTVPRDIVLKPETITAERLVNEQNTEIR